MLERQVKLKYRFFADVIDNEAVSFYFQAFVIVFFGERRHGVF